jgi:CRP-like cAMP-binding protein
MSETGKLERIIPFMLETPFFENFEPGEIKQVLQNMQTLKLKQGEVIFREGETGDAWYILYTGKAEALKESDSGAKVVNTFGPRACFGEMAILDGSPRSATIRITEDAEVFRFPAAMFYDAPENEQLVAYKVGFRMARVLAARHRVLTDRLVDVIQEHEAREVGSEIIPMVDRLI